MFTGAACIGEYLKKTCTLKFLNMSFNPISDVGMPQLIKGLNQNVSLTELHVRECVDYQLYVQNAIVVG